MRMVDIIHNKRIGGELTREELEFFVQGVTGGSIPDYQVSALLMAICFRSMAAREIADSQKPFGRHIFNLGHGILPDAKIENVEALCAELGING